jgi:hypothetical protein
MRKRLACLSKFHGGADATNGGRFGEDIAMRRVFLTVIAAAAVLVSADAQAATEQEQQACYRQTVQARAGNDIVSSLLAGQVIRQIESPAVMQDRVSLTASVISSVEFAVKRERGSFGRRIAMNEIPPLADAFRRNVQSIDFLDKEMRGLAAMGIGFEHGQKLLAAVSCACGAIPVQRRR